MADFHLTGIHHASYLVQDLTRSLEFYQQVLGLALDASRPDLGYPGAWLQIGSQQLHLMQLPDPDAGRSVPAHGGRDRHVALATQGLDALVERLQDRGIDYTLSRSGRKALFCRDPDGNALEFVEIPA